MSKSLGLIMVLVLAGLLLSCVKHGERVPRLLLSDKLASPEAAILYNRLDSLSKRGVMIGHQDDLAYGIGWRGDIFRSDINDVCGDFPAVFGWDLGHIGDSLNIDGVPFSQMKQWAIAVNEKGGINTYSWHPRNFVTGGNSWDTQINFSEILPNGNQHKVLKQKLDLIADFFNSVKDSNGKQIPVIFRPFHEMNGGWFWWGTNSCTHEEYKQLFQFTVNYLRDKKGLHQIIYVFSPDVYESAEEYLEFYPGDAYVDILGVDDYKGIHSRETSYQTISHLAIISRLAQQKNKLYTYSETGVEQIPDSAWFTRVLLPVLSEHSLQPKPCWVLFWRNGRPDHYFAPYPGHPSVNDFQKFKADSLTFFLTDI